jgi:hypothetical protein
MTVEGRARERSCEGRLAVEHQLVTHEGSAVINKAPTASRGKGQGWSPSKEVNLSDKQRLPLSLRSLKAFRLD